MVFDAVSRLGWSVDVWHHPIKQVITNVLEADVWWGDEDVDEGARLWYGDNHLEGDGAEVDAAGFSKTLPETGDKGIGDAKKREGKRNVPKAIIEEGCVVRYLSLIHSLRRCLDILSHRTVINGNLEIF